MPSSRHRAVQNYRTRLADKSLMRFEVLGRGTDRELIRSVARHLAQDDSRAQTVRAVLVQSLASERATTGSILTALRASPLVGAEIDFSHALETGRSGFQPATPRRQKREQVLTLWDPPIAHWTWPG